MIIKNGKNISSVIKGGQVISKIYKGSSLIYNSIKNLCNAVADNMLDYRSDYAKYTIENGKVTTTGNTLTGFIIPVKPNTTYSFGFKILRTGASYVALRIREYETIDEGYAGGNVTQPINEQYQKDGQCSATITTLETTKYVLLAFYTTAIAEIYDFMANEGDTLLDYVPYV
jgi:hypothetical protein